MAPLRKFTRIPRVRAALAAATFGTWLTAGAWAEPAPLSFERTLLLAELEAPALQARQQAIEAAQYEVGPADALPDPTVFIGTSALPVEGANALEFDAEPMTMQMVGVRQAVPNRAKRHAREAIAMAALGRSQAERDVVLARVRRGAAAAWIELYHAERGMALFDAWEEDSRLLVQAATAGVESGRRASGVLLAQREALTVDALRDRQRAAVDAARARLRQWIGDAADLALASQPPPLELSAAELQHRLHKHPELQLFGSIASEAEARVEAATAEKRPDWEVQFGYQRRPGFDDMVAVELSVDLPLFTRRRQDPLIAAERQRVLQVEAERAAAYREHAAMLEADVANYRRLERDVRRLADRTLPLMQTLVDQHLAEYRGGEGELTELVRARQALLATRLDLIEAESARGQLAAQLRYAYLEETDR